MKNFSNYNVYYTDRKEKTDKNDKKGLKSRGGVLLLTSPDIPITPISKFSNSNCELLIAELPTINMVMILLCRPSGKNFCPIKFQEALNHVQNFLNANTEDLTGKHVTFLGDFNFPKN